MPTRSLTLPAGVVSVAASARLAACDGMNHQDFVLLARDFLEAFTGRHVKCRRLLDRIREASYRRGMKMPEFSISCLVSCGTFLFGFLWESSRQVWSLKVILHRFRRLSRWHSAVH